ncbi:MAG: GTP cyclohydrolase I, partial [Bacteroidota bacterium]
MKLEQPLEEQFEERGDDHIGSAQETPIREDAFVLDDDEKIERIQQNVREIMLTLGLDLEDDSLKGTPNRVAKMYVNELFGGLHPKRKPNSSTFQNKYKYGEMLVEKNITLYSTCEHHLLPIVGKAHVAYI